MPIDERANLGSLIDPQMRIDGNDGRFTSRIPKEVRQDPEILEKLEELDNSTRQYMQFDMNRF